jgi:glutathione S-transferase
MPTNLVLHYHPLSSFSHKALVALYEKGVDFKPAIINYGDPASRDAFFALWPLGKIPVLRDEARDLTLPESSAIIEYLDELSPAPHRLLPTNPAARIQARLWDRIFDNYIHVPMQKLVNDRLRVDGEKDARGVADARALLTSTYELLDRHMQTRTWAAGEDFSLADCAACPALFYAGIVAPFDAHPHVAAYFERLVARPSFARALREARPYFNLFPFRDDIPARFLDAD